MPETESTSINARMLGRLEELRRKAQLRELAEVGGVNLYSNDYLGLATDPRLKLAVIEAIAQTPRMSSTGSRLLSGHAQVWDELEEEFSQFAGTSAALYFSSGYAANTGLLSAILAKDDIVFSDSLNHASLIDGVRLSGARKVIYAHCDMNALEDGLKQPTTSGQRVIVTESIFSMDGDRAPLAEIIQLARRYGAEVIVDEAHATGTQGKGGRGIVVELGLQNEVLAIVHTCGKALASMGAFVCGSRALKPYLINHARSFIFSTAMPPYFAGQVRAALRLATAMDAEREYLAVLADRLREKLRELNLDTSASSSQIVPLMCGENEAALQLADSLQASGFAVRAIRPPTVPQGTARLRFSLTARVTYSDVDQLANAIAQHISKQRRIEEQVVPG
ncbi:MAG TPA: 8-amino-7-oxononanoate synthase [Terriglobales bacterium]|nr:8-amino-7-oxononanoate synthase [Terriglobales bacterium]